MPLLAFPLLLLLPHLCVALHAVLAGVPSIKASIVYQKLICLLHSSRKTHRRRSQFCIDPNLIIPVNLFILHHHPTSTLHPLDQHKLYDLQPCPIWKSTTRKTARLSAKDIGRNCLVLMRSVSRDRKAHIDLPVSLWQCCILSRLRSIC